MQGIYTYIPETNYVPYIVSFGVQSIVFLHQYFPKYACFLAVDTKRKAEDIFCTTAIVRGITETKDEYFERNTLVG